MSRYRDSVITHAAYAVILLGGLLIDAGATDLVSQSGQPIHRSSSMGSSGQRSLSAAEKTRRVNNPIKEPRCAEPSQPPSRSSSPPARSRRAAATPRRPNSPSRPRPRPPLPRPLLHHPQHRPSPGGSVCPAHPKVLPPEPTAAAPSSARRSAATLNLSGTQPRRSQPSEHTRAIIDT